MRSVPAALLLLTTLAACAEPKPAAPPIPPVGVSILTTIGDSASTIEGLAEHAGRLYVCDWKDGTIYRINPADPTPVAVGGLPVAPGTVVLGIAADSAGNLFFAEPASGSIYRVPAYRLSARNFDRKKDARVFATGAVGANAIAFDHPGGQLWITGGPTGNLYHVGEAGGPVSIAASGYSTVAPDTTQPNREYLVNGIAFDSRGVIYTANTGTGEISSIVIGTGYQLRSTATFVRDARLIGADGLLMDAEDNLWVTANYRNALARVGPDGTVTIVASSTPSGTYTDSSMVPAYPQTGQPNGLRFPAEFKRIGNVVYLANLNFPVGANAGQPVKGASIAAVTLP